MLLIIIVILVLLAGVSGVASHHKDKIKYYFNVVSTTEILLFLGLATTPYTLECFNIKVENNALYLIWGVVVNGLIFNLILKFKDSHNTNIINSKKIIVLKNIIGRSVFYLQVVSKDERVRSMTPATEVEHSLDVSSIIDMKNYYSHFPNVQDNQFHAILHLASDFESSARRFESLQPLVIAYSSQSIKLWLKITSLFILLSESIRTIDPEKFFDEDTMIKTGIKNSTLSKIISLLTDIEKLYEELETSIYIYADKGAT